MTADTTERVHLSVAEARALSERAMRGIGYEPEEARILADHVIDAALCGYEYSGLPKLLNVAEHPPLQGGPPSDARAQGDERVGAVRRWKRK
jgi:LDH2 family malate/lactate/ureidoglycolate dehydrogenase